jgi:hypothetical protein
MRERESERERERERDDSTEGSAIENGRMNQDWLSENYKRELKRRKKSKKWKKRKHYLPLPGADSFVVITHNPTYPFNIFKNLHQLQYFKNYVAWKRDTNNREGSYLRGAQENKAGAKIRKGTT